MNLDSKYRAIEDLERTSKEISRQITDLPASLLAFLLKVTHLTQMPPMK